MTTTHRDAPSVLDAIRCALGYEGELSTGARHALLVLATYYPTIFPSLDRLAREMGITRRGAIKRLRELEEAGVLATTVEGRGSRQRAYRTLRIAGLVPDSSLVSERSPSSVSAGSPTRCPSVHPKSNEGQAEEESLNCIADFDELTDRAALILEGLGPVDRNRLRREIERDGGWLDLRSTSYIAQRVVREFRPDDARSIELQFAGAVREASPTTYAPAATR